MLKAQNIRACLSSNRKRPFFQPSLSNSFLDSESSSSKKKLVVAVAVVVVVVVVAVAVVAVVIVVVFVAVVAVAVVAVVIVDSPLFITTMLSFLKHVFIHLASSGGLLRAMGMVVIDLNLMRFLFSIIQIF